ncbi:hypothetical protein CAC42_524 [Sphaceloma murrayae]|uniref:Uncharacterized protein n=1 Tax=Sphaceloma murrayae TaxID=2082308 RepID=A0A2K1R3R5_9PEZI|nr:hypothetical protein CAC42_524 [Sphaceloma murrayae]
MQDSRVSSMVHSLVSAFERGGNVLRKQKRACQDHGADRQGPIKLLSRSLRHGRKAVRREYDEGAERVGERFGQVDATASLGLAHTLLKLNAGLMSVVAGLLDRKGKGKGGVNYQSLTLLSEACTEEAVCTLRDLRYRLESRDRPCLRYGDGRHCNAQQQLIECGAASPKRQKTNKASSTNPKPYWELQLVHHKPRKGKRHGGKSSSRASASHKPSLSTGRSDDAAAALRRHKHKTSVRSSASSVTLVSGHRDRAPCACSIRLHDRTSTQSRLRSTDGEGLVKEESRDPCSDANDGSDAMRDTAVYTGEPSRVCPPTAPRRLVPRAKTARYSMASTKIGEIPSDEWDRTGVVPALGPVSPIEESPWGWGGPISSLAEGKGARFGFLGLFKKRMPQRVV